MSRLNCTLGIVAFVGSAAASAWGALEGQDTKNTDQQARAAVAHSQQNSSWTKTLEDRAQRGTLHDVLQIVRGDTGKWSEEPRLQHAPPIQEKPAKVLLDEWSDQLSERKFQLTTSDDNWLLFRTGQLNDNDRIWVERIQRRGNQFTVVVGQAVWQGRYQKNFTQHVVLGVNLGKLEPGQYEAKWIIKPLAFSKFDRPGRLGENWPDDERLGDQKLTELPVTFTVAPSAP